MFSEIAPHYDFLNHLLSCQVDRYWRWRTVRLSGLKGDQPILDVCTGTGDLAIAYYRHLKGKVQVVGTDFCQKMIDLGNRKKAAMRIDDQLTFLEADTQHLPFEENRFQVVSVAFGLRNVCDTDQGLKEMVRVCAPSGRVVVLEFSMPQWQPFKWVYGWYFRRVLPRIGQWLARNRHQAYRYLPESVGVFPSGEALAEKMRNSGLSNVSIRPLTFGIATLYVGQKPA